MGAGFSWFQHFIRLVLNPEVHSPLLAASVVAAALSLALPGRPGLLVIEFNNYLVISSAKYMYNKSTVLSRTFQHCTL